MRLMFRSARNGILELQLGCQVKKTEFWGEMRLGEMKFL